MTSKLKSLGVDRMSLDNMSLDDRLALIEEIWGSIESGQRLPMSDEMRDELDRRLADHEAHPDDVVAWEQVKAEALARMKR